MSDPKTINVGGRPRKELNVDHFKKLCAFQCTLIEIAHFFDVSEDTVERWCKRELELGFADAFKKYGAGGKMALRRWQFAAAKKGNTALLIFLGKQYLGQRDQPETQDKETELPQPIYAVVNNADKTSA